MPHNPVPVDPQSSESRTNPAERTLMIDVAREYYEFRRNKVDIGNRLGLSRFKVARLLEAARAEGIVSIAINSGAVLDDIAIALADHLYLDSCKVVEAYGDIDGLRTNVGSLAGRYLASTLSSGEVLGIGWGRTLGSVLSQVRAFPPVSVVELAGNVFGDVHSESADIIQGIADLTGADARTLAVPMLHDNANTARWFSVQRSVSNVTASFDHVTTAVIAAGAISPRIDSMAYVGATDAIMKKVLASRAVGEVLGILFASDGSVVAGELLRHRIGITAPQLAKVPRVILVAAHPSKAAAVRAVVASGVPTELVVDVQLAGALLEMDAPPRLPRRDRAASLTP